jgi:hypothetical protein
VRRRRICTNRRRQGSSSCRVHPCTGGHIWGSFEGSSIEAASFEAASFLVLLGSQCSPPLPLVTAVFARLLGPLSVPSFPVVSPALPGSPRFPPVPWVCCSQRRGLVPRTSQPFSNVRGPEKSLRLLMGPEKPLRLVGSLKNNKSVGFQRDDPQRVPQNRPVTRLHRED